MSTQNRPPMQQSARPDGARPRVGSGKRHGKASFGSRPLPTAWTTGQDPLEGTIHSPRSKALALPHRRGRWLTVGVPTVLAGAFGISSFVILGISSLVGGGGLLVPLLAGLGIAAVVGGGMGLLLRNRSPQPVRLGRASAEIPAGTRSMLEKIIKDSRLQRRRIQRMQQRKGEPAVKQTLHRAEVLLLRIDAMLGSATVQSRRASDPDVMMLEGMTDRYVPELVDALEDTVGFLAPATPEDARDRATQNLHSIDAQLIVLANRIDRLENDIVAGVTRSLDVHSEFLRARFTDSGKDPFIDR